MACQASLVISWNIETFHGPLHLNTNKWRASVTTASFSYRLQTKGTIAPISKNLSLTKKATVSAYHIQFDLVIIIVKKTVRLQCLLFPNLSIFSRNAAETKITALERNIKTLMVEIEELRQVKINLEGSISKWQAENADWKKKYENEARLRVEEGDALKKKFTLEITSLTDNLHNLEQKLKAAENAKVDKNTK